MKNLELNQFGLCELATDEIRKLNGGGPGPCPPSLINTEPAGGEIVGAVEFGVQLLVLLL